MRMNGMEGGVKRRLNVGVKAGGEGESMYELGEEPLSMNEWMQKAACKGMLSDLWDENVPDPDALRVCFRCPVQLECLAYGVRRVYGSDAGVLGGTGVQDRQRIRTGKSRPGQVLERNLRRLVAYDHGWALQLESEAAQPRLRLVS
jgi:hypothetical protein